MTKAARSFVFVAALAACKQSPSIVPTPVPTPTPEPASSTCADPRGPEEVQVDQPDSLIVTDRGVRWFLSKHLGELVWLRADGQIGTLPLRPAVVDRTDCSGLWLCVPEVEGQLRCFSNPAGHHRTDWRPLWSMTVALSDAPTLQPATRWQDTPRKRLVGAASNGKLALLAFDDIRYGEFARSWDEPIYSGVQLQLWDVERGTVVDPNAGHVDGWVEPKAAWCGADSCTFVARVAVLPRRYASEPMQIVAATVPGGRNEVLSEEESMTKVLDVGAAHVVVTQTSNALLIVALDADGSIRGRTEHPVFESFARNYALDDDIVVHDWTLLRVSDRAEVSALADPQTRMSRLWGAQLVDGIVLAGLTVEDSYENMGAYAFIPTSPSDATVTWTSLLGAAAPNWTDTTFGYDMQWLVRPDRAAVLVWPNGVGYRLLLIPVRAPCP
jgi:hypothetical protein